jgi:hypothetical protein
MERDQLQKYAEVFSAALNKNMPPEMAFVLVLIPKPDKAKKMNDAAFISNMPDLMACKAVASVLHSKSAEKLMELGATPEQLAELAKNAEDLVEKAVENSPFGNPFR